MDFLRCCTLFLGFTAKTLEARVSYYYYYYNYKSTDYSDASLKLQEHFTYQILF